MIKEWVEELFDSCREGIEEIDIETAREDLKRFAEEGWTLPDGITAEDYCEIWNELVREQNKQAREQ